MEKTKRGNRGPPSAGPPLRPPAAGWLVDTAGKPRSSSHKRPALKGVEAEREARLKSIASDGKARLEKQHANFLKKEFKPNKDWWGSVPVD